MDVRLDEPDRLAQCWPRLIEVAMAPEQIAELVSRGRAPGREGKEGDEGECLTRTNRTAVVGPALQARRPEGYKP
jgi:hypothetical protein